MNPLDELAEYLRLSQTKIRLQEAGRETYSRWLTALEQVRADARRYQELRALFAGAVGAGIEVNDARLVYDKAEPGKEVRVYWYPDTPIGFYQEHGATIDEAVDKAIETAAALALKEVE